MLTHKEELELYAKAFNTLNEMWWTLDNEWLDENIIDTIRNATDIIDKYVMNSKRFKQEEKENFMELTDELKDRIYFNC